MGDLNRMLSDLSRVVDHLVKVLTDDLALNGGKVRERATVGKLRQSLGIVL